MNIKNIHTRTIKASQNKLIKLLQTLSSDNDCIWPKEKWPAMRFENGLKIGSKGGHGPIRYWIENYTPEEGIQFRFSKPTGFQGFHKLEIQKLTQESTVITHTIAMQTAGKSTWLWLFIIRPLHNALMVDLLNKVENQFSDTQKSTNWNLWVKFLRKQMTKKRI